MSSKRSPPVATPYGGEDRFRLRGWRDPRMRAADIERASDDLVTLKALAARFAGEAVYSRLDLEAWNLELNDWVRLERFEPG